MLIAACQGADRASPDTTGIGGKGDDPDQPDTSLLDGEMLALLDQAADHLDPANFGDDGAGDGGANDGGEDGGGVGTCENACGSDQPQGACYCDAACTGNGDCCDDYQQHCDGDAGDGGDGDAPGDAGDGGDPGDGGDGGGSASCAGNCDSSDDQGGCYCDTACVTNGDCCRDYQSQCGGSGDPGDGGGDPGDGGGGDGSSAGSCAGLCGGAGSDGVCYCDEACIESDDCCEDYFTECPSGAPATDGGLDNELATSPGDPQLATSSCLKVIDGNVNASKVLQAAGRGAAKTGSRCFVVAVYASGATGGSAAPATSVVCLVATVGGGAVGAAQSYIKQKRKDIAMCTVETAAVVLTAILNAAENIGVFEMAKPDTSDIEGLKDPALECNTPTYKESNYHKDEACGPEVQGGNDWGANPDCSDWLKLGNTKKERCIEGKRRADRLARCHWGRIIGANSSWNGEPDAAHARAIRKARDAAKYCTTMVYNECLEDDDEQADDEDVAKQKALDLMCG